MKQQKICNKLNAWKGYKTEILMKRFRLLQSVKLSKNEKKAALEDILFTLSPYYDKLLKDLKESENNKDSLGVKMLSVRQILTYRAALYAVTERNADSAIHELHDFIKNFGRYKHGELSELETYLIYILCQQIYLLL